MSAFAVAVKDSYLKLIKELYAYSARKIFALNALGNVYTTATYAWAMFAVSSLNKLSFAMFILLKLERNSANYCTPMIL